MMRSIYTVYCSNCSKDFLSASTSETLLGLSEGYGVDQMSVFLDSMMKTVAIDFAIRENHWPGCDRPLMALRSEGYE